MRYLIILTAVVGLWNVPARSQTAAAGDEPQNTQSGTATGVVGAFGNNTAPTEYVPPTASERLRYYLRSTYSPGSIVWSALGAGIAQWDDKPKEWKQGAEAYGDRFGNSYAIHVIKGTLQFGGSTVLHEDYRYVRSQDSGFWKRSKHAVTQSLVARNSAGTEHFAYSRLGSAAGAAFISRIWQPHSTNTAGDGAVEFGILIGENAGSNMFHEFWPDVKRHLFHKD